MEPDRRGAIVRAHHLVHPGRLGVNAGRRGLSLIIQTDVDLMTDPDGEIAH